MKCGTLGGFLLIAALAAGPAALASAQGVTAPETEGFRICNHSSHEVMVAKAVNLTPGGSPADIEAEGWWRVGSRTCLVLYPGPLRFRYYLVYAHVVNSDLEWAGTVGICVRAESFKLRGGICREGPDRRMFRQIDTGTASPSLHTYDLTD
jgi:uncharacterized membrane protein